MAIMVFCLGFSLKGTSLHPQIWKIPESFIEQGENIFPVFGFPHIAYMEIHGFEA